MKPSTNPLNNPFDLKSYGSLTGHQIELFNIKSSLQYDRKLLDDMFNFILLNINDYDLLDDVYKSLEDYITSLNINISKSLYHENNDKENLD